MSEQTEPVIDCSRLKKLDESGKLELLQRLNGWSINADGKLCRTFVLQNFAESLALANLVGAIAEEIGHHPDLLVRWGSLSVEIWTHSLSRQNDAALTEADFFLAARINELRA
ncbi:MAG: 4a-hydroxytetrahydrobiopterin dehydratase [Candidatus Melainabacteria bacterium]|nr:4a-hydroxytetrahydrobiopterin dehydratase [Candidatus Melainabacteria bacterium]